VLAVALLPPGAAAKCHRDGSAKATTQLPATTLAFRR
jgi:hypothetical protein